MRRVLACAAVLMLALTGCTGEDAALPGTTAGADAGADGAPAPAEEGFSFTIEPTSLSVAAAKSASLKARLVRTNYTGAVNVTATGLPAGITLSSAGFVDGANEAEVTVAASNVAAVGATSITVTAEAANHRYSRTAVVNLDVRGASGSVDATFGKDGTVKGLYATGESSAEAVAVDSSGRILVGGYTKSGGSFAPVLLRLTPAGTLDTTFGSGGKASPVVAGKIYRVGLDPSERILAVGQSGAPSYASISRFDANGQPDTSFATTGRKVSAGLSGAGFTESKFEAFTFSGTDVIAVGTAFVQGSPDPRGAVAQIDNNGNETVAAANWGYPEEGVGCVDVVPRDGKFLAPCDSQGVSFAAGALGTRTAVNELIYATRIVLTPSGKLVVAHFRKLKRFTAAGVLDGVDIEDTGFVSSIVAVQPDEKMVLAGLAPPSRLVLARYQVDGSLDRSFGVEGMTEIEVGGTNPMPSDMVVTKDGKIVVAVHTSTSPQELVVLRVWQ